MINRVYAGARFGHWTAIAGCHPYRKGRFGWLCQCRCGLRKVLLAYDLTSGRSTGCKACAFSRWEEWLIACQREPGECWPWPGKPDPRGYGRATVNGRLQGAHRAVYERLVGLIPKELDLDHLCRNPICVNPSHMEPVTHRENILRGLAPPAINARKTHCKRGHELNDENVYRFNSEYTVGARACRICRKARN